MADKEIGLFQIRNGKQRNLPTALEHAELSLSTDECRMFVGLPATITPASLVAGRRKTTTTGNNFTVRGSGEENVEILTEFTPQHVLDRVLYQAIRTIVPAGDSITLQVPYTSRMFMDYVAFPDDASILESGSAQIVTINDGVLMSQQNNSNIEEEPPQVEIGTVSLGNAVVNVEVINNNTSDFNFEYTARGWGA